MDYVEFTGKTVDDALTRASIQLGIPSTEIDYEVIEKGSNGILGFGSKNAVIKAKKKEEADESEAVNTESSVKESVSSESAETAKDKETSTKSEGSQSKKADSNANPVNVEECTNSAKTFLNDVFKAMNLEVTIESSFDDENNILNLDLKGPEMGIIIGKRGQTLDSLQYLTSLAINRKTDKYVKVNIDTEDYRRRRKETLENLAHNVAYKVKRTRRPASLEAMNPYERRIIHFALQDDPYVTTHSEGEEPYRHVVVTLKK